MYVSSICIGTQVSIIKLKLFVPGLTRFEQNLSGQLLFQEYLNLI